MKRSEALTLIANQLDFLNDNFYGFKTNHTDVEMRQADVILTTLEEAGMQPPNITLDELLPDSELKTAEEVKAHFYARWEPE